MTRYNANYLDDAALAKLGFAAVGENVRIHATCVLVGCDRMRIGHNVRIDPFCVLTADDPVDIGSFVHIAAHVFVAGGAGVSISDYVGISHGSRVLSASDSYVEGALMGPTVPHALRSVDARRVRLDRFSCIGANSVVLPGAHLEEGATVGALALVKGVLPAWSVSVGSPARPVKTRDRDGVLRAAEAHRAMLATS